MNATPLKVTVITTVFNNHAFIRGTIESVLAQTYPNIEYIVKDAGSSDGTLDVIREYRGRLRLIEQPDRGMYDGLNQAIQAASGDIIAVLNSDDFYATPHAIAHMVRAMQETAAEVGWGDIVLVDRADVKKIVRRWKSSPYGVGKFRRGWHPPHPAFFVRREAYEKYGIFTTKLRIAADYELMLRMLERYHASSCYLPETLVTMRTGGASGSLWARLWKMRREDARAWKMNGLRGGFVTALLKPFSKLGQF